MYLDVWELNRNQINELKENYYYDILSEIDGPDYSCPGDIPDQIIFTHYNHIAFTADDFFCTVEQ